MSQPSVTSAETAIGYGPSKDGAASSGSSNTSSASHCVVIYNRLPYHLRVVPSRRGSHGKVLPLQDGLLIAAAAAGRVSVGELIDDQLELEFESVVWNTDSLTEKVSESGKAAPRFRCLVSPAHAPVRALQHTSYNASGVGESQVLLLPQRDPASFLAQVRGDALISALCLPGTHETFGRYGWPISQCQEPTSTIEAQLKAGIRFMDFRVTPKGEKGKERLLAFHGSTDEKIELGAALQQVYDFLQGEGRTEFLLLSLKPEGGDAGLMQKLLFDLYIDEAHRPLWFLDARIPSLDEARGKIVMLSRFGHSDEQPGGIHPPIWPNNYKGLFSYDLPSKGQRVTTQDWFSIGSLRYLDDKFGLVTSLLASDAAHNGSTLALNFCSASTFPLALPPAVAKGIKGPRCLAVRGMNVRLRDYVAGFLAAQSNGAGRSSSDPDGHHDDAAAAAAAARPGAHAGMQAVFALDFYGFAEAIDLVPLLIEANFPPASAP
ncbi:unnamed protein product [Parajaminaea phylloscopi]